MSKEKIEYSTGRSHYFESENYRSLNFWIGQEMRLPSCRLAAMVFWQHLEPAQYARDEGYLPRAGVVAIGRKISLDLLPPLLEEWSRVRFVATACLSISAFSNIIACPGDT